jgi:hypothetical protein
MSSNDWSLLIEEFGIRALQCPTAIDAAVNLISTSNGLWLKFGVRRFIDRLFRCLGDRVSRRACNGEDQCNHPQSLGIRRQSCIGCISTILDVSRGVHIFLMLRNCREIHQEPWLHRP